MAMSKKTAGAVALPAHNDLFATVSWLDRRSPPHAGAAGEQHHGLSVLAHRAAGPRPNPEPSACEIRAQDCVAADDTIELVSRYRGAAAENAGSSPFLLRRGSPRQLGKRELRQFFQEYSATSKLQPLVGEIGWAHNRRLMGDMLAFMGSQYRLENI